MFHTKMTDLNAQLGALETAITRAEALHAETAQRFSAARARLADLQAALRAPSGPARTGQRPRPAAETRSLASAAEPGEQPSETVSEETVAHEIAGQCLRGGVNADACLGETVDGIRIGPEMVSAVQTYLDVVRTLPGLTLVNQPIDVSRFGPGRFHLVDALVIADGTASLIDFCYAGDRLSGADAFSKAMPLGLGTIRFLESFHPIRTVRLMTIHPGRNHIGSLDISRADLETWAHRACTLDREVAPSEKVSL